MHMKLRVTSPSHFPKQVEREAYWEIIAYGCGGWQTVPDKISISLILIWNLLWDYVNVKFEEIFLKTIKKLVVV